MPLANVQQVQAPDFSTIGDLLRGANASFSNAFTSANSILGQYQEGQQAKADASILTDLASVKNEADLNKFLADNPLANRNLSPEMQKTILAMRNTALGYDTTRIGNQNSIDMNSRANAGENRDQTDWIYDNKARDALNAATPGFLNAYVGALTVGQAAPGTPGTGLGPQQGPTIFAAAEKQYGLPAGYLATTAQIESGGNPNAKNPNSSAGGWFQQTDANARDYGVANKFDPVQSTEGAAKFAADNANILRKRLGREPTAAELYLAHQQGGGGASALLANPNAKAVDIVGTDAVRLNGGDLNMTAGEFAGLWLNKYNKVSGTPFQGGAVTGPNGYMANPAMLAGIQTLQGLAASGTVSPEVIQTLIDSLTGAQQKGQEQINARDATMQTNAAADALRVGILDPNNVTNSAVVRSVLADPKLRGSTAITAAQDASTILNDSNIAAVVAPSTLQDPQVQTSVDSANTNAQRLLDATDPAKADALAASMSSDPGAALIKATQESNANNGLTSDYVNREASRLAAEAGQGVTSSDIAATMKLMDDQGIRVEDMLIGTNFDQSIIVDRARSLFGTAAKQDLASQKAANASEAGARSAIQLQITTLTTQLAKMSSNDPNRIAVQSQINKLKSDLVQIGTDLGSAINKVLVTPKTAPGYVDQVQGIYDQIDRDPNMSASDKVRRKADIATRTGIKP